MSKVMLVNVTHVEESRVAVLENGVLAAYEIETINRAQIKGNIYNAVVDNVHPTLEAAFLRISPELKGFLPLDEVNFNLLPARDDSKKAGKIGRHLRAGQKIMAQVVREPFSEKPPTVSTYFSLPGRFLVLMPGVESSGVSRKIDDPDQRDRLKNIVEELCPPDGFGVIVRTAGLGQTKLELQRDMRYLLRLWQSIQRASRDAEFPSLVYREADLVIRTIRDHLSSDIGEVWIDSKDTYEKALAFVRDVMPGRAKVLRLYNGDRPLFNKFNLEDQIETIFKRRVPLPSGGEIVIDGTEALTAVDVNSARSKRKGDAEETTLQTNLEAAAEIARQLRLRDLGGLIVIDFIDMATPRNRKKVEEAMRAALKGDRARHDMTRISKMGLMEIARQRVKGAKMAAMYNACPTCEGYGLIKTLEAAALAALRKLQTQSTRGDIGGLRLKLPDEVAGWMLNNKRDDLVQIERRQKLRIDVVADPNMLRHEAKIESLPRDTPAESAPHVAADRVPALSPSGGEPVRPVPAPQTSEPEIREAATATEPEPRKRRRRRRRPSSASETQTDARSETATTKTETRTETKAENDDSQVLPFEPRAQDAARGAETEPLPAEGEQDTRGRKRRRRRRRPRSSDAAGNARPTESGPTTAPPETEPRIVPAGVRSDELMPAAAGRPKRRTKSTPRRRGKGDNKRD